MLDLVHKILYTGIGFAALSEEKAKEIVADLEKRGEVNAEEGKKLAQDLIDKANKHAQQFRDAVEQEVNKVLKTAGICSRKDLQQLQDRLDAFQARLDQLEQRCCPQPDDSNS